MRSLFRRPLPCHSATAYRVCTLAILVVSICSHNLKCAAGALLAWHGIAWHHWAKETTVKWILRRKYHYYYYTNTNSPLDVCTLHFQSVGNDYSESTECVVYSMRTPVRNPHILHRPHASRVLAPCRVTLCAFDSATQHKTHCQSTEPPANNAPFWSSMPWWKIHCTLALCVWRQLPLNVTKTTARVIKHPSKWVCIQRQLTRTHTVPALRSDGGRLVVWCPAWSPHAIQSVPITMSTISGADSWPTFYDHILFLTVQKNGSHLTLRFREKLKSILELYLPPGGVISYHKWNN